MVLGQLPVAGRPSNLGGGGGEVQWCCVNLQCRGVLLI